MKQISQNKRSGEIRVADVEPPSLENGMVLVKNYFSVISAGTEKTTIDNRKSSLLQRAKSQPEEVQKVVAEMKRTGLLKTYKRIMSKLDSSAALGYSSSGIVLAVDDKVHDIEVGDKVACAGAEFANHSDVVVVPRNLVAKIPDGVSMESAAYTTIAAIALQGIRQTAPTLGETVVVIGLGLLGQFTIQFLKANGCSVIGIDLYDHVLGIAAKSGADLTLHRDRDDIESRVMTYTKGYGADAVIITAGTSSNDPVELSGRLLRERGRMIVVGAAKMDIPRGNFYRKEIDVRLSRSYGPGRYDREYELKARDYPISYVRWTENRNMEAYLDLLSQNRLDIRLLTTHRFPVERALEAYELIEGGKKEPYIGIVITYDDLEEPELNAITTAATVSGEIRISPRRSTLSIGFIGAGSFASQFLIPHLKEMPFVTLDTVCNRTGLTSSDMRNKFGFRKSTTNADDIFLSESIGTVFIATRHGDHADYVLRSLRNGHHVFVEKPLALNETELSAIEQLVHGNAGIQGKIQLMVGFNRRFSPLVRKMKDFFSGSTEPSIIHYYVNAGFLPKDHWTHDPEEGGGRIIGETCHFIDTIQYLTDAEPVRVHAENMRSANTQLAGYDNVNITMRMSDGSLGIITYAANGATSLPKERIVMSSANATAIMNNFADLELVRGGQRSTSKSPGDKGHKNEVSAFMDAVRRQSGEVISFDSMLLTTRTTFSILRSLRDREEVEL